MQSTLAQIKSAAKVKTSPPPPIILSSVASKSTVAVPPTWPFTDLLCLFLVALVVIHDVPVLLSALLDVVSTGPVPIHRQEVRFFLSQGLAPCNLGEFLSRLRELVMKLVRACFLIRTLCLLQQLLIVHSQEALGQRRVAGQDRKVFFLTAIDQCSGRWGSRRQRGQLAVHTHVRSFLSFPWFGGWSRRGCIAAVWPTIKINGKLVHF